MNDRATYANADARRLPLADKSVHMIATSPPYWGLRSYDTGPNKHAELGAEKLHDCGAWARRSIIGFRGVPEFEEDGDGNAVFVGLPPEPIYGPPAPPCGACYVCNMREWAREMWRVLRDDGCMFLNLGDSYASGTKSDNRTPDERSASSTLGPKRNGLGGGNSAHIAVSFGPQKKEMPGLKPKDLCGIPWRVALALQSDGWYLRSDCIWEKPNAMPSSVTDRPSTSHEYIFLLTKRPRYYWDNEAVKEPQSKGANGSRFTTGKTGINGNGRVSSLPREESLYRNLRTVWTIATAPYAGAHYATWPPALVERMVKAGSSERGVCPECGKPWERVVERELTGVNEFRPDNGMPGRTGNGLTRRRAGDPVSTTTGWRPTCAHADADAVPAIVLDPFCGSGTTLEVARRLGRIGLGFDLSETYLRDNAAVRLGHDKLAAWGRGIVDTGDYSDLFRAHAHANGARSEP